MTLSPAAWVLVGFLAGTITTSFAFVVSHSMTLQTAKALGSQEPEFVFEPETSSIENQDIRISLDEEEAE
jgi:hypothetical protein